MLASLALRLTSAAAAKPAPPSAEGVEFFERQVRPVLVEQCYKCHGPDGKAKGGLRLDTRDGVLRGGDSGPAVVPGDAKGSRLVESVRYGNPDLQMPPKHRLPAAQVADLARWVEMGAPDPRAGDPAAPPPPARPAAEHWSFRRPTAAAEPAVRDAAWPRNGVDRFVLTALEARGLKPSPEADPRTLARRVTFDLTGLPPTPAEVDAFAADPSADAYDRLVDRLLASPRYGERWGRYWLDLARYSDTKGYVYAREERQFVHAHAYRDWVIAALNRDLPYDRFLALQIAGDQMAGQPGAVAGEPGTTAGASAATDVAPSDLAAMGFLTVGRRFLGVTHDIIDDRIDVLSRTTQGLTVACARCHDHKFDPIPTADYYSLYGVFAASTERLLPLGKAPADSEAGRAYSAGLAERQRKLAGAYAARLAALTAKLRAQAEAYLAAVPTAGSLPTEEFYEIRDADDLNPVVVRQWQAYLLRAAKRSDPVLAPWAALAALKPDRFAQDAPAVLDRLDAAAGGGDPAGDKVNPLVMRALRERPPASMVDVAHAYGRLLVQVDREWLAAKADKYAAPSLAALPDADREQVRQVLYGPDAPVNVPPGSVADTEWFFDEPARQEFGRLQIDIDRWNIASPAAPDHALVLVDRPPEAVHNPRVFRRGNAADRGAEVPRQFLAAVAGPGRRPFAVGSGRLELARAIASPDNPLTARVMVNRVWQHHFGEGIVRTPSDFGVRSQPPSHPELLDWLAVRFVDGGWSLKALHRLLVTSATYRQRSDQDAAGFAADPENRLLWRASRDRLDFEAARDALLATSGELDLTAGGKPADVGGARRTVYAMVDRQFLPGVFRTFDFANPDLHTPQRSATTVPQQALFLMNGPFAADRARAMSRRPEVAAATSPEGKVRALYRLAYQRPPTAGELTAAVRFVDAAGVEPAPAVAANAWRYGTGRYDAASDRVADFAPMPHFTGASWQGDAAWPGPALGWARLTADGGHPGDDAAHAVVRRWVAPRDAVVDVSGVVVHDVAAGNGIEARVISSRRGTLARHVVHNGRVGAKAAGVAVAAGETIDFVVAIAGELNSNQYLWAPVVTARDGSRGVMPAGGGGAVTTTAATWDSAADFSLGAPSPPPPPDGWARLAHVLMMSNEFVFVD